MFKQINTFKNTHVIRNFTMSIFFLFGSCSDAEQYAKKVCILNTVNIRLLLRVLTLHYTEFASVSFESIEKVILGEYMKKIL